MVAFRWSELVLYLCPIVMMVVIDRFFRSYLNYFETYKFSLAEILLPLWLSLIHAFSHLTLGFSLVALVIYYTSLMLVIQLYHYIRVIEEFTYTRYFRQMSRLVFATWTLFLLGLVGLRLYTLFL